MAIFPLDIRTELKLPSGWSNISSDVYVRDVKVITRGIRDQATTADPASLSLTLNNRSGKYSHRYAASPLFGILNRNTPIRVSVPAQGDHFLQVDGLSDSYASTPDAASLDVTDLDVRAEIQMDNWTCSPTQQIILSKWYSPTGQRSFYMAVNEGELWLVTSPDGTNTHVTRSDVKLRAPKSGRLAVRCTLDVDDGAGNKVNRFYTAPTMAGPWTLISTNTKPGTTSVFNSTTPLYLGSVNSTAGVFSVVGRVYRAEVRNGIDGTVVASPDLRSATAGATSFTDSAGLVWSVADGAEIRDREDRFVGEVSSWPQKWTTDDADVWTPIQASGVLRRMGQGKKALASTLRRRIPSGKPTAYWPFEDAQSASRAYSPIAGVQPATVNGVSWAALDTLVSSSPLPSLTTSGSLWAPVPAATSGQWQVEMVYNADNKIPPSAGNHIEVIGYRSPNGAVRSWSVRMKDTSCHVYGYDSDGTLVVDQGIAIGADVFNGWTRLRFWAKDNTGGTFSWRVEWQDIGGSPGGFTGTVSGSCGRLSAVAATWLADLAGWGIGHLAVFPTAQNTTFDGSDDAYIGETAWDRMARIASEESLLLTRVSGRLPTAKVGYQRPDSLLSILEAAAAADGGMLTEDPYRPCLRYRERSSLYAQEPALTLSYTAPGLAADLEPVDDDTAIVNDVTVQRDAGSSARVFLADGPLSIQDPPLGIGPYDTSVTLSLADDSQPEPIAAWLLHLGTFDGARYPTVTVQLHKPGAESLVPKVLAMREGDKIRLTGLPAWVSSEDVDLIVNGWSETLDLYQWTVTFNCAPAGPWNTAVLNTVTEDFEDATFNVSLSSAGAAAWSRSTAHYQYGSYSYRSGTITNNQDSDAILTLPAGAASLSFWYYTSSEDAGPGYTGDYLSVLLDGVEAMRAQGATPWTKATLDVSSASTVTFRYHKDNSTAVGEDAVFIDQLRVTIGTLPALKAGASSSALAAAASSSATALYVATSSGPLWTIDASQFPMNVRVGGEVVSASACTPGAVDTFSRTTSSGWGTANVGGTWSTSGGAASDYSTNGSFGRVSMTAINSSRYTVLPSPSADVDVSVSAATSALATGGPHYAGVVARWTDANNSYYARLSFNTDQTLTLTLQKRVGGTQTDLTSVTVPGTHVAGSLYRVRFKVSGSSLSAKAWPATDSEPVNWQATATDTALTAAGSIGTRSVLSSANTNTLPVTFSYDNFELSNPQVMTVARSVNGIVKAQTAGTPVTVAATAPVAL